MAKTKHHLDKYESHHFSMNYMKDANGTPTLPDDCGFIFLGDIGRYNNPANDFWKNYLNSKLENLTADNFSSKLIEFFAHNSFNMQDPNKIAVQFGYDLSHSFAVVLEKVGDKYVVNLADSWVRERPDLLNAVHTIVSLAILVANSKETKSKNLQELMGEIVEFEKSKPLNYEISKKKLNLFTQDGSDGVCVYATSVHMLMHYYGIKLNKDIHLSTSTKKSSSYILRSLAKLWMDKQISSEELLATIIKFNEFAPNYTSSAIPDSISKVPNNVVEVIKKFVEYDIGNFIQPTEENSAEVTIHNPNDDAMATVYNKEHLALLDILKQQREKPDTLLITPTLTPTAPKKDDLPTIEIVKPDIVVEAKKPSRFTIGFSLSLLSFIVSVVGIALAIHFAIIPLIIISSLVALGTVIYAGYCVFAQESGSTKVIPTNSQLKPHADTITQDKAKDLFVNREQEKNKGNSITH